MSVLEAAFDAYNRAHFRGRLPKPSRVCWTTTGRHPKEAKDKDDPHTCAFCWADEKNPANRPWVKEGEIHIHARWKKHEFIWRWFLLHEMVHWQLRNHKIDGTHSTTEGHGRAFHRGMKRLAARGAFKDIW